MIRIGDDFMKNWKKLAAMLLAGVMALAMLTACGGDGGAGGGSTAKKDEDVQTEQAIIQEMSKKAGSTSFSNNGTLKNVAWETLSKIDTDTGSIKWSDAHTVKTTDGKTIFVNVATNGDVGYGDKNVTANNVTSLESSKLLDWMESHNLFHDIDFKLVNRWVDVGVAAKKINGKVYVAVAVSVSWK